MDHSISGTADEIPYVHSASLGEPGCAKNVHHTHTETTLAVCHYVDEKENDGYLDEPHMAIKFSNLDIKERS